jgi:hypothetical protein
MADRSVLDCHRCFVLNSVGKAWGGRNDARVNLDQCVTSHADTGGEFHNSVVRVTGSYFKDIPDDGAQVLDDDNDGPTWPACTARASRLSSRTASSSPRGMTAWITTGPG